MPGLDKTNLFEWENAFDSQIKAAKIQYIVNFWNVETNQWWYVFIFLHNQYYCQPKQLTVVTQVFAFFNSDIIEN